MKPTMELIKSINIISYIEFLKDCCHKTETALLVLPILQERLDSIALRSWNWHCHFLLKSNKSVRYEQYKDLYNIYSSDIKNKIQVHEDNLKYAFTLADPEKVRNIININPNTAAIKIAETIDFTDINARLNAFELYFNTSLEIDLEDFKNKSRFNTRAADRELEIALNEEFNYLEDILEGRFCAGYLRDFNAVKEFARLEFLHRLTLPHINNSNAVKPTSTLSKTQFTELTKALIECGALRYETEKQAVLALSNAFQINIEKSEFDRILQKIKGRNNQEETIFLDNLKRSLKDWINK